MLLRRGQLHAGYTLIEVLVVLGILATITVAALPAFGTFRSGRDVERDRRAIVAVLRSAQSRAMTGTGDASWGVRFSGDGYVLYRGPTYADGMIGNVEYRLAGSTYAATSVFASGAGTTDRVLFEKLRGTTENHGTLTLVGIERTVEVTVTAAGAIE